MNAASLTTLELGFADRAEPDLDDEWATLLRRDVLEAGAASVEQQNRPAPEGSKAVEGLIAGLIVKAAPGALALVVEAVRGLLQRSSGRRRVSLRIGADELVLDGATTEDQDQLVAAFLARHSSGGLEASS